MWGWHKNTQLLGLNQQLGILAIWQFFILLFVVYVTSSVFVKVFHWKAEQFVASQCSLTGNGS